MRPQRLIQRLLALFRMRQLDRGASVSQVLTMDAAIGSALARPRFQLTLLGLFAAVALLLAAAGISSVMSYVISRRTQE